jgi:hypothetical protein
MGPLLLHATAAGGDPTDCLYPVVAFNPQAAANLGLSALPTANPAAAGGLPVVGSAPLTNLDAAVSSRSTFAGGAVASVTAAVTVGTNNDKTGYSLATPPPTTAAIATAVWTDATAGDFTVAGSPGLVLVGQLKGAFGACTSVYTAAALANAPTGGGATAAQIAAAVWTDATAADFAAAGSIGKALFVAAAPGAAGGHFIAGTNAATAVTTSFTTTFTGNLTGSVASVAGNVAGNVVGSVGSVAGNVAGSVASVTAAVSLNPAQPLAAPRALDGVADGSLTVGDAQWAAICAAAGKESVVGTAYKVMTPATGTALRTFTLDNSSSPTSRT